MIRICKRGHDKLKPYGCYVKSHIVNGKRYVMYQCAVCGREQRRKRYARFERKR